MSHSQNLFSLIQQEGISCKDKLHRATEQRLQKHMFFDGSIIDKPFRHSPLFYRAFLCDESAQSANSNLKVNGKLLGLEMKSGKMKGTALYNSIF